MSLTYKSFHSNYTLENLFMCIYCKTFSKSNAIVTFKYFVLVFSKGYHIRISEDFKSIKCVWLSSKHG